MPMDGVMLGFVARELDSVLRDGRVDRVIQPEKDEIHLLIRAGGTNHRLGTQRVGECRPAPT